MHRAGNQAVHLTQGQQHGGEQPVVPQLLRRFPQRKLPGTAQPDQRFHVVRPDGVGVHDLHRRRKLDCLLAGHPFDRVGISEQHASRDAALRADGGGTDDPRVGAFGQDDAAVGVPWPAG